MNHTPGPWRMESPHVVRGKSNVVVAKLIDSKEPYPQKQANACLIATAPELLEALEDLLLECGLACQMGGWDGSTTIRSMERSRAAIAKARGQ